MEEIKDFGFETFAALVAIIPIVVEILKGLFKPAPGLWTQVFSWVVGMLLTFGVWLLGNFAGIGFLVNVPWWLMLLNGFGACLASNGVFDTGLVEWLLGLFKKK